MGFILPGVQFAFADVPFHDLEYGIDLTVQGSGTFTLTMSDPSLYCLKSKEEQETENAAWSEQFVTALTTTITKMGNLGIRYDKLAYAAEKMLPVIGGQLETVWKEAYGMELLSFTFSSVMTDDAGIEKLIRAKKAKAETAPAEPKKQEMPKAEEVRAKFCPGCGLRLSDRGAKVRFCPQCGKAIHS